MTCRRGGPLPAVDTLSNISVPGAAPRDRSGELDSPAAWRRLAVATVLGTVGSVGMWSVPVALPAVQADFGVARADASLPYTLAMVGFALGGVLMGRLSDRRGVVVPLLCGAAALSLGCVPPARRNARAVRARARPAHRHRRLRQLRAADRRYLAMVRAPARDRGRHRLCGNYIAGAVWPPVLQHFISTKDGAHPHRRRHCLRADHAAADLGAAATPADARSLSAGAAAVTSARGFGLSPNALQAVLCIAGLSCCVAMAMPQVHIVAYCGDLGYGVARGAEMLALMLGCGIVSRIASGFIADRIGGVATLLLGSVLQGAALFLYLLFDGLASLYVISALFGLFQGGIVSMYAVIVREYPAAGGRHAARPRADGDAVRDGAGRLDVRRDLRSHRLLSGGLRQRLCSGTCSTSRSRSGC